MSTQARKESGVKRRWLPSFTDLALLSALLLVLVLSWHGMPNPHASPAPEPAATHAAAR